MVTIRLVKLEAWLPGKAASWRDVAGDERAELSFIIDAKPYHEHALVVSADLKRGKTHIAVKERADFQEHVSEWVRDSPPGTKPANYTPRRDAFVHFLATLIPLIPSPHRNRLTRQYRSSFTGAQVATAISILLVFFGFGGVGSSLNDRDAPLLSFVVVLLGFVGLIATVIMVRRRKRAVSVTPQSEAAPRNLGLVDSWHAVVSGVDT